ncbi:MAG: DUF4157 domain-containing protein [Candidatus Thiodiazotropha sp.]
MLKQTRAFFEPRFGHDFSRVRVHHDPAAAASAEEVAAHAYTVGHHVVFNRGQYAPDTHGGRELLAHELAHVVQQSSASVAPARPRLQRRNIFEEFAGLFRSDDFDTATLQAYLSTLRRTRDIEDFTDSDNKARAVTRAWFEGDSEFVLTQDLKALLIREMLSGFTGDDDEEAILELLERSYNYELEHIFGAGGVTVAALNGAFQGEQQRCLDAFFARRFVGGAEALSQGRVEPMGEAVPFGYEVATSCRYNIMFPGLGVDWSLPCILGILCSADRPVIDALRGFDVEEVISIDVEFWEYNGSSWAVRETRHPNGAADSEASPPEVKIIADRNCSLAVRTLIHEVRHQHQSPGSRLQREGDAFHYTEQWMLDRGLPGYGNGFRSTDPNTGETTIDRAAVDTYVQQRYPGTTGAVNETVIGHRSGDNHTEIRAADGSRFFRPPQAGDTHWGEPNFQGRRRIPPQQWRCPGPAQTTAATLPAGVLRTDFNQQIVDSAGAL